jgi:hypothetical protein
MCKFNKIYRYEAFKALKHPWISRVPNAQIPLTMMDCYNKQDLIKKFKTFLGIGMFFSLYKSIHTQLFVLQPKKLDSSPSRHDPFLEYEDFEAEEIRIRTVRKFKKSQTGIFTSSFMKKVPEKKELSRNNLPRIASKNYTLSLNTTSNFSNLNSSLTPMSQKNVKVERKTSSNFFTSAFKITKSPVYNKLNNLAKGKMSLHLSKTIK